MKVSVCMITYNHEKFIAEAIEGVISQKTDYHYELIIGDDCSIDNTREILLDYQGKFPNKIKLLLPEKNLGMMPNFIATLQACTGKYIAICEGDDYWTDVDKLQKQVDFMEANLDYVICFHRVFNQIGNERSVSTLNTSDQEETYTLKDLAHDNFIHTPSVMFRNNQIEYFPEWFKDAPAGDYVLHMLNAKNGKIKYFPDIMAVYRIHTTSNWSSLDRFTILERWLKVLDFLLSEDFDSETLNIIRSRKRAYINELLFKYFEADRNLFLEKLKVFIADDPKIGLDWLFYHYPEITKRMEVSLNEIKQSRTYKFSRILSSFKTKILK